MGVLVKMKNVFSYLINGGIILPKENQYLSIIKRGAKVSIVGNLDKSELRSIVSQLYERI